MHVTVLGGGSFGTVLANVAAEAGQTVTLWARDEAQVEEMTASGENSRYLPGFQLHPSLRYTTDLAEAVTPAELIFVSIPSKAFRQVLQQARPFFDARQMLVSTTKGIERDSFALMSQVLREETPCQRIGVLSGPNLAREIAARMPAGSVIASASPELRECVHQVLSAPYFRVFANTDVYGVELGGALKNIYAVAAGMAAALELGENSRAILMTRSLAEMSRFAVHLGANPLTFLGLAGVGDLIATCSSPLSRNFQVGLALGKGKSLDEVMGDLEQTAEGINTIQQVKLRADQLGVRMPVVSALHDVIFNRQPLLDVIRGLMMGSGRSSDVEFVLPKV